ncbi:phosphoribosyl-ATP pyrophosphohydrolase [Lactobacillus helsingborgensis]|uniref:nucleoside triphosphate pyrophosphohydrolase n=1 Tax=Lactobacillus helsingborgensis TaxID=1218494 RepID=UPI00164F5CB8|nr:nucleoside triphosphate pyrophosphohydrolase [Lactobacillus helsingborgensis]MBC6356556.1 phosphoribosyl-ATP pyrophosphohydrolase [Lactobacillus helsingborgensis]
MKKLVRDKIPEFAHYATYRELAPKEIEPALKQKLIEETNEVLAAKTEENLVEELGDVYEVILAYLKFKNVDQETFLKQVNKKRALKGGFSKFLEMNWEE